MHHHTERIPWDAIWLTALTVAVIAGSLAVPASADAGSVLDDVQIEQDDCQDALVETACQARTLAAHAAVGFYERAQDMLAGQTDDTTASEAASDYQDSFNQNNQTIETWTNNRATASTDANVLKLTFDIEGETESVYAVADVNGSDYENASVVSSTNREVDDSCTLDGGAARNAGSEVDRFVSEFAEPGEDVTSTYLKELGRRYAGHVDCSFGLK